MRAISADSWVKRPGLLWATITMLFLRRAHGSVRRSTLAWDARGQGSFLK